MNIEVRDFFLTLFSRIVLVVCREHLGFLYGCLLARPFTQKQGTAQGIASACERKKLEFFLCILSKKHLVSPGLGLTNDLHSKKNAKNDSAPSALADE